MQRHGRRSVAAVVLLAAVAALGLVATVAGPAAATASPGIYDFYDCSGPAGTPSSFSATKQQTPAFGGSPSAGVAYRIDGGGIFVVHAFGGDPIGNGIGPDKLPVTCSADIPNVGTVTFSGFFSPRG